MSGILNLESPVVRAVTRVGDLAVLSLMWFVGCIPVVTIGASSTAMYSAIHKVFTQKEGIAAAEFLKCFKSNLRQATLSFLPLGALELLLLAECFVTEFLQEQGTAWLNLRPVFLVLSYPEKPQPSMALFMGGCELFDSSSSPRQGTTSTGKKKQSCPFEQLCFLGLGDQIKFDLCVGVDDVVGGVGAVN